MTTAAKSSFLRAWITLRPHSLQVMCLVRPLAPRCNCRSLPRWYDECSQRCGARRAISTSWQGISENVGLLNAVVAIEVGRVKELGTCIGRQGPCHSKELPRYHEPAHSQRRQRKQVPRHSQKRQRAQKPGHSVTRSHPQKTGHSGP